MTEQERMAVYLLGQHLWDCAWFEYNVSFGDKDVARMELATELARIAQEG